MNRVQYEQERFALGDELRTLRKSKRVTGLALAKRTKISQSKLSKIETGALIPSTDDLQRIFRALDLKNPETQRLKERARRASHFLVSCLLAI